MKTTTSSRSSCGRSFLLRFNLGSGSYRVLVLQLQLLLLVLLLLERAPVFVLSFVLQGPLPTRPTIPIFQSSSEEDNSNNNNSFLQELKERQESIRQQDKAKVQRWRKAQCQSQVKIVLSNDWIRRLDGDRGIVVLGSAQSHVHVASLETGRILAQTPENAVDFIQCTDDDNNDHDLRILYGSYDGGGSIAVAVEASFIAHAHRGGSVHLWIFDPQQEFLIPQGSMRMLDGVLVTALALDEEYLYVGTRDGRLLVFSRLEELPLALQTEPAHSWNLTGAVLSLSIASEIDAIVATTSHGSVNLFSLEDGSLGSFSPPFDSNERRSSQVYPRSVCFVSHQNNKVVDNDTSSLTYSIACGGNDGSLYLQPLHMKGDRVDPSSPFVRPLQQIRPRHFGSVQCLISPVPDVLVSGGQDGTLRVWDPLESKCLYQFVGYKVWLGSLWSDDDQRYLLSDGSDNTVIVHDFSAVEAKKS